MVETIASILTNDPSELRELIQKAEGKIKRVQIDIVDGKFAGNKTIDPAILGGIETDLLLDFHLMTVNPTDWIERCVRGGADRIIGQIERMDDQMGFVEKLQEAGVSVGLAVDLKTPIGGIESSIISDLDVILLMSVPAGFGGQVFDRSVFEKIKELNKIRSENSGKFRICIDGGVTEDLIGELAALGVDEVIMGRRWFEKYG
jgi:ribulose-phosphate 3-epimerase